MNIPRERERLENKRSGYEVGATVSAVISTFYLLAFNITAFSNYLLKGGLHLLITSFIVHLIGECYYTHKLEKLREENE